MTEALITASITLALAGIAGAYKLGYDRSRKNGNSMMLDKYMTKELCMERHRVLANKLDDIAKAVECLPDIKAWIDLQKKKEDYRERTGSY
ncbi:MAG: hypothetical protein N3A02_07515 [Rectinema sp.]|nr:hypothetical protein [Rectinema sp.]